MYSADFFQNIIEEEFSRLKIANEPARLYDPIRYMIRIGGKRLRPSILLMSNELFGGDFQKVIHPALGIEVFHNFTLLHDDIMDKAPLRRSKPTVHEKWNSNIAILSGDTMYVLAYQMVMQVDDFHLRNVLDVFNYTAIKVCEGQQLD